MALGFALSAVFDTPKVGGGVAGFIQLLFVGSFAGIHFGLFLQPGLEGLKSNAHDRSAQLTLTAALHLLPVVALGEFAFRLGEGEAKQKGIGWEEWTTLTWLIGDALIVFLLYSWMVHVAPGKPLMPP